MKLMYKILHHAKKLYQDFVQNSTKAGGIVRRVAFFFAPQNLKLLKTYFYTSQIEKNKVIFLFTFCNQFTFSNKSLHDRKSKFICIANQSCSSSD